MKLLSFNMQYGFGADGVYDLGRAAQVIAAADIACLQEVDRHWSRSGFDDQPALLETLLPERYCVFGPGFDMDASQLLAGGQPAPAIRADDRLALADPVEPSASFALDGDDRPDQHPNRGP